MALSFQHNWWDILLVALPKSVVRSSHIETCWICLFWKEFVFISIISVVARRPLGWCFERVDVKGSLTAKKLFEVQVFRCGWTCLWVKLSRMSANRLSALSQGHGVSLVSRLLPLLGQLRLQHNANHSGELFAEDGDVEVTLPLQIHLLDSSNKDWQYQLTTSDASVDWEIEIEGSWFY